MRTVIISDLHLGSRQRLDLLRTPAIADRLIDALSGADQLVLLGDALELRDLPLARVLRLAEPLLARLGAALRGGRIVLVAGNHDHQLAAGVLSGPAPLGLGRERAARSGVAGAVAVALGHREVVVSYPGVWIRPDVWATHGHYMDAHTAAMTLECVSSAVLQGLCARRRPPRDAEDYERALVPLYRALFAIAQRPRLTEAASAAKRLLRLLEQRERAARSAMAGPTGPRGGPVAGAMALFGGATRVASGEGETRRAGIGPMAEVLRTLAVDADHVVFGHTHRAVQVAPTAACRAQLTNTGNWVLENGRHELDEAHLPGVMTVVESEGAPRLEWVLDESSLQHHHASLHDKRTTKG